MPTALHQIPRRAPSRNLTRASAVPSRQLHRTEPGTYVHRLQQAAGNQATAKWLRSQGIQAALAVGPSDDAYEREADRVAEHVLRMPDAGSAVAIQPTPPKIRRLCAECEHEEDPVQPKSERESGPPDVTPGLESYLTTSRDAGLPLPATARDYFGPRFGQDFSGVRVHTDNGAARAAAGISAQAFTAGRSIHFAAGRFRPGTPAGDRLLAHELTHVVQQSGGGAGASPQPARLQRQPGQPPGPPDPPGKPDFDCSVDFQAGKFKDFLNCCAKTPLGRGCSKDVIDGVCKVTGLCGDKPKEKDNCPPGFKAGATGAHRGECCQVGIVAEDERSCCPPQRIVRDPLGSKCCPPGTLPDPAQRTCITLSPPLPPSFCLPGRQTSKGECCVPPLVLRGNKCVLPPPPPPPPRPLPSPVEIFFRKDKPSPKGAGGAAVGENLTAEGGANFRKLAAELRGNPALKVQLVGRASPEGSDEYNLALGRRRAELIAAALEGEGIESGRIADPPEAELRSECQPVRDGVVSCGEAGATGASDRQVLARVFLPEP